MRRHRRRRLLHPGLGLTGLGLLAGCGVLPSPGPPPASAPRIGYLTHDRSFSADPYADAFRRGLRELGYVEGGNLAVEWRYAERPDQLPALATELAGLPVAAIVAAGGQAVSAAKAATATVPIVGPVIGDPVALGFVASLARPGGNVTGLTTLSASGIAGKRLQLLQETAPGLTRVAVLWNSGSSAKVPEYKETEAAAQALGLALHSLEVRGPGDFAAAFAAAASGQSDGLATFTDPLTLTHAAPIADVARASRLPSVFETRPFAAAGGLLAYGPDALDLYRRAAGYVDKILKGARPADLPVEQPTRWEFVINLATARALGLTIPPPVLARATDVVR